MDIYLESDNKVYDIEMQTITKGNLGLRTRYYQSMIDSELLNKGESFDRLKETIIIFICLTDPFGEELPEYKFQTICNTRSTLLLNDKSTKYFYNAQAYKTCTDSGIKSFLQLLAIHKEESPLTARINQEINKAVSTEIWRHEYMVWNLAINDAVKQELSEILPVRLKEELDKEIENKKVNQATAFLKLNKLTPEEIAVALEMDVKTVKQLQKEL